MYTKPQIDRLLRWHHCRRSVSVRNAIAGHFNDLIVQTAERLLRRLPASVDRSDLIADGFLGLLDAIGAFQPGRAEFTTFASRRIFGAMLDGLRARDPISRSTRHKVRELQSTIDRLRTRTGVSPTPQELATEMGVSLDQYARTVTAARGTMTRSLSGGRIWDDDRRDQLSADHLGDPRQVDPADAMDRKLQREALIAGLSRAERLIVMLYYYEDMTMKEIGLTLDLCESRVSQMHTSILQRLKCKLQGVQFEAA